MQSIMIVIRKEVETKSEAVIFKEAVKSALGKVDDYEIHSHYGYEENETVKVEKKK